VKAVVQRVKSARVEVNGVSVASIGQGLLTLLGVVPSDDQNDVNWIIEKIGKLRIFEDDEKKMNKSLLDLKLQHLIVSQFTLCGDTKKGNRPSFTGAALPKDAAVWVDAAIEKSKALGIQTESGVFGADMQVVLQNDGPVTFILDSCEKTK